MLNGHLATLNRFITRSTDMQAILPSLEEEWSRLLLERGMRDDFPRAEEVSDLTTGRDAVSLPRRLGVSCDHGLSSER